MGNVDEHSASLAADPLPDSWQLPPGRILITGANGHLGQRLIRTLAARVPLRALVRSASAQAQVQGLLERLPRGSEGSADVQIVTGAYDDPQVLTEAVRDCVSAVHLVGIIKQGQNNTFEQAHVDTTRALVQAAEQHQLTRLVYLSIVGSAPEHRNPCLASKGDAEQLLLAGSVPTTIYQVPMVLGEGDYASKALGARARSSRAVTLRANSLEQPIYAGDVVRAVIRGLLDTSTEAQHLTLPGPEQLTRRSLIARAGAVVHNVPNIISLPVGLGLLAAGVLEKLQANPPVTRAMLGVLDHDDSADGTAAQAYLGFPLTSLDDTLRLCLDGGKHRQV
ncbi:MAG: SDR family oxidoreductase [Pseudomonadales bacterium]